MTTVRISDNTLLGKKRRGTFSAGCYLVRKRNNQFELLILHKRWLDGMERYVLPKGHQEERETLEDTAKRETIEESGYTNFELLSYIGSNTYELDLDEIIIKTDHYYLAILRNEETIPKRPEIYEKDVVVENIWIDLEEGFGLLTFENQEEMNNKVKSLLKEV